MKFKVLAQVHAKRMHVCVLNVYFTDVECIITDNTQYRYLTS